MPNRKKYDLVIERTPERLIEVVNEAIEHGYILHGNFIYIDHHYVQAIVLKDIK